MSESRAEIWNRAHTSGDLGPLSGSDASEMLRHHGLEAFDRREATWTVLDIGVGLGQASRYFRELGYTVDALDISDVAEVTVRPWIRRFYLDEKIEELPTEEYDLAVSHLVAQHMAEPSLRSQVRFVAHALKVGGIFSLHLAGSRIDGENNWTMPEIPEGFDGRMCRDPDYAETMLSELLGKRFTVERAGRFMEWPEFKSYWFFMRIRRIA